MALPWRSKTPQVRSRDSEKETARLSEGRRVPMSGAGRQKGDVRTPTFLIEVKDTAAVSYRIELETLDKISHEARTSGRLPQLRLTIGGQSWRMLREQDYLEMEECWSRHSANS
jgi:hypothetical protein